MGARRSHPHVKIHLSDFMWTKCIYVHLTSISLFFLRARGGGGVEGGASVLVRQIGIRFQISVTAVSHGEAQSEGFG